MLIYLFIFIIGVCIGSFLNVVIYRFEKEVSVVYPSSFCPYCKTPIKWYDNIPILSYINLGGKCRVCKTHISIEYPIVEFLTGILTLIYYIKWGNSSFLWFIAFSFITYVLIVVSVIDFKTMMLSDLFSYIIAFLGIVSSYINPLFSGGAKERILQSFSGIITGIMVIYLLMVIGKFIYKKDAVGDGDMFLFGAIGSFIGFKGIFDVVIISSFIGAFYGLILILTKKLNRFSYIPFGPFLATASVVKIYFNISVLNII